MRAPKRNKPPKSHKFVWSIANIKDYLSKKYGDKPKVVTGGFAPYRTSTVEVLADNHLPVLLWRFIVDKAKSVKNTIIETYHLFPIAKIAFIVGIIASIGYIIYVCDGERTIANLITNTKKPVAFKITDKYYTCIHKVVDCSFHKDGRVDINEIVKCQPAYTTVGAGFGEVKCQEGDYAQTSFLLSNITGDYEAKETKIVVPTQIYNKFNINDIIYQRCSKSDCDGTLTLASQW